ncbi:hypothetical protein, partial [Erwinia persicina]|uniref:hypothetical protein n=1 Tax=Erwinia persicina TaxID=55211 RepID=UPI001A7E8560
YPAIFTILEHLSEGDSWMGMSLSFEISDTHSQSGITEHSAPTGKRKRVRSRDGLHIPHHPVPDFSTGNQPMAIFCIYYNHLP